MLSLENGVGCTRDLTVPGRVGGRVGVEAGEGIPPLLRAVALSALTIRRWLLVVPDIWGNENV